MFDFLNPLGLPLKYGIICFVFGGVGVFLARLIGVGEQDVSYLSMMVATGIGGVIAGFIRKRRSKGK